MKLTTRQQNYLLNEYRRNINKKNIFPIFNCHKCGINTNKISKNKFILFDTRTNKAVVDNNNIFSDNTIYERYLEAEQENPKQYFIGESRLRLIYAKQFPEYSITKNIVPTYPISALLTADMLESGSQEEIDKVWLEKYNSVNKRHTKWIKLKERPIDIHSDLISQDLRISMIREYRFLHQKDAKNWIAQNIDNLKLICLNCS
jgi:hypothetical protein